MKKILLITAASMFMLTGCDLNINEDPNYPTESAVTTDLQFPAVENSIADALGDQMFNYAGFFAQYFEQRPEMNQYNDLAELNLDESSDLFNRCYSNLFAQALEDINSIKKRDTNTADLFACTVMRAYAYQLLVDNMSDAPYTEALQGSSNTMPKWDDGETVYKGVLKELDDAEAAINSSDLMTLTDAMLSKNISQWKGFANALRLRMYLRLIDGGIDASTYEAKVKTLISAGNFFTGDVAWDVYSDAEGQYNPWYGSMFKLSAENHVAAYPIVTYYMSTNDPRISYGILTRSADNTYVGQIPGAKTMYKEWGEKDWKNAQVSEINYAPSKTMPIYLFTQSELQFLIAEAQLRFNSNDAAAKTAYEAGVKADFTSRGVDGAATFLTGKRVNWDSQATSADKLNLIYMQKWAALFYRDHMEAWSEVRRTDVPATYSGAAQGVYKDPTSYTAGNMIIPALHYKTDGLCKRVPYPENARQHNTNTPAVKTIGDRVFWDAK
jgi:hypothetical protein